MTLFVKYPSEHTMANILLTVWSFIEIQKGKRGKVLFLFSRGLMLDGK
jgi:hypothetical protein